MKRKPWATGLVASALILSLTAPSGLAAGSPAHQFSDMDDAAWALSAVATMSVNGVVKGDGDGNFRPTAAVSHQEAIALAIREMGLEQQAQAMTIDELFIIGTTIHDFSQVQGWASPDVALAAKLHLLPPSSDSGLYFPGYGTLQPEAPASRLWATILLVKAVGLEPEAEVSMNTTLSFADATHIPAEARGYVAAAAKHGLMRGIYGDDGQLYFMAGSPVTRAQMAVLLARSDDQLAYTPERAAARKHEIRGRVVLADRAAGTVTLLHHGITTTYNLSSDAAVFVDDRLAPVSEVEATMKAKLELDAQGQVLLLASWAADDKGKDQATRDQAEDRFEVEGRLVNGTDSRLTVLSRGAVYTYKLANDCKVESHGQPVAFNDIEYGATVHARLDGWGRVVLVDAKNPNRTDDQDKAATDGTQTGLVATVGHNAKGETTLEIIAKARTGVRVPYILAHNATLDFAGQSITAADLKAGDIVAFQAEGNQILKLSLFTHS